MNRVILSPEYFADPTIGKPISNADIYVGIPDLDPEIVFNQKSISVLQEDGTVVPVSQPINTGSGGVPLYSGSPVTILTEGDYSLKVLDSLGGQVFYIPSVEDYDSTINQFSADDMYGLTQFTGMTDGATAKIQGFFFTSPESNPVGSGRFIYQDGVAKSIANGGTIIDPSNIGGFDGTISTLSAFLAAQGAGTGTGCWIKLFDGPIDASFFGASHDLISDDSAPINAAIASTIDNYVVISGDALFNSQIDNPDAIPIVCYGELVWGGSGEDAIIIGDSATSATTPESSIESVIKIRSDATDTADAYAAVVLHNIQRGKFDFYIGDEGYGFHTGLKLVGTDSGCVFNTISLRRVQDCVNLIELNAAGINGWVNQNTFIGGNLRNQSAFTYAGDVSGVLANKQSSSTINGNVFVGTSFELRNANASYNTYVVKGDGTDSFRYNTLDAIRFEGTDYLIGGEGVYDNKIDVGYTLPNITADTEIINGATDADTLDLVLNNISSRNTGLTEEWVKAAAISRDNCFIRSGVIYPPAKALWWSSGRSKNATGTRQDDYIDFASTTLLGIEFDLSEETRAFYRSVLVRIISKTGQLGRPSVALFDAGGSVITSGSVVNAGDYTASGQIWRYGSDITTENSVNQWSFADTVKAAIVGVAGGALSAQITELQYFIRPGSRVKVKLGSLAGHFDSNAPAMAGIPDSPAGGDSYVQGQFATNYVVASAQPIGWYYTGAAWLSGPVF